MKMGAISAYIAPGSAGGGAPDRASPHFESRDRRGTQRFVGHKLTEGHAGRCTSGDSRPVAGRIADAVFHGGVEPAPFALQHPSRQSPTRRATSRWRCSLCDGGAQGPRPRRAPKPRAQQIPTRCIPSAPPRIERRLPPTGDSLIPFRFRGRPGRVPSGRHRSCGTA